MKSRTSLSIVFALLASALLIVCLNAWLAFRSVQALSESEVWVTHTWRVIESLEVVTYSLKDAEAAARGYLLTRQEPYRASYAQAKAEMPGELQTVAGLIIDNPAEQATLRELRAFIESRVSLLDQSISEREAGATDSLRLQVLNETGLAEMNRVRLLVDQMRRTEQGLLAQRVAAAHLHAQHARETVIVSSVADLLLLLIMCRYIVSERRLRSRADQTSGRLEKLQSISEVALTHLALDELTVELLSRVRKVISADAVLLCRLRDGSLTVDTVSGAAVAPGTVIPAAEDGPLDRALRQDRVVTVPDTASTPLIPEVLRRHALSLVIAPLSASPSVAGILVAGRQTALAFDNPDGEILAVAASRIAMAMARANAYEAEQRARRDAESKADEVRLLNAQLEERVGKRTADLETINRELEAFSYSVSHDLRAPLRTVDGFSLALEEDYATVLEGNGQDYLRRIRNGVQRMGQLIDSLLQLSRVTRAELIQEPVDLSALAAAVAADLAGQNPGRVIDFEIQPGLECIGDSRLLRAALENLLGNAVKFTAREAVAKIELGRSGNSYFIRDNGVGFDMHYADKLFSAFNRLHGDKDFQGSGIGLATVARIVRRQHGSIWAESELGRGATFWFTLGER